MKKKLIRYRPGSFEHMAHAVSSYLETKGWSVLVAGGVSIEGRPPREYHYRFVLDFTGSKRGTRET